MMTIEDFRTKKYNDLLCLIIVNNSTRRCEYYWLTGELVVGCTVLPVVGQCTTSQRNLNQYTVQYMVLHTGVVQCSSKEGGTHPTKTGTEMQIFTSVLPVVCEYSSTTDCCMHTSLCSVQEDGILEQVKMWNVECFFKHSISID